MSGWLARHASSTTIPLSTRRPACSASSTPGRIPSPATRTSATSSPPTVVRTTHEPARRRDFAPDEPPADHREPHTLARQRAQAPVIVESAEIDDLVGLEREAPRGAAGGEE